MPRFRRMKPRRRFGRRKKPSVWRKMLNAVPHIPRTVYGLKRAYASIRNLINVEPKMIDTTVNLSPTTTGLVSALTLCAQGTTDQTRVGNSILAKSIHFRLRCTLNGSATRTSAGWFLFIDKQNALGTAPTMADLLQNTQPESNINRDFSDRFVILRRGIFTQSITGNQINDIEVYVNLSHLHVKFDGTAADQASAAENHIYFGCNSTEATNVPALFAQVRFRFYDN